MTKSSLNHISAVRIFVHDLGVSKEFFIDKLGLPLSLEIPACLIFKTGGTQLIIEPIAIDDQEHKEYVGRFTGISFDVINIKAVHKQLIDKGVVFDSGPSKQDWGGALAHFKDPDGNILTLVEHF